MTAIMQQPKPKLECTKCGASTEAACSCGVAYIPAIERAAAAIEADPEKSNRAIAAEIGVDEKMVRKARKAGADLSAPKTAPATADKAAVETTAPATADKSAVEKRVGRDGKTRRMPKPTKPTPATVEELRTALVAARAATEAADRDLEGFLRGAIGAAPCHITALRQIAAMWGDLATLLDRYETAAPATKEAPTVESPTSAAEAIDGEPLTDQETVEALLSDLDLTADDASTDVVLDESDESAIKSAIERAKAAA